MSNENVKLPPEFGKDDLASRRIGCLFNADVRDFIADLERYTGCYIDKRFWDSRFWTELKIRYGVETAHLGYIEQ